MPTNNLSVKNRQNSGQNCFFTKTRRASLLFNSFFSLSALNLGGEIWAPIETNNSAENICMLVCRNVSRQNYLSAYWGRALTAQNWAPSIIVGFEGRWGGGVEGGGGLVGVGVAKERKAREGRNVSFTAKTQRFNRNTKLIFEANERAIEKECSFLFCPSLL